MTSPRGVLTASNKMSNITVGFSNDANRVTDIDRWSEWTDGESPVTAKIDTKEPLSSAMTVTTPALSVLTKRPIEDYRRQWPQTDCDRRMIILGDWQWCSIKFVQMYRQLQLVTERVSNSLNMKMWDKDSKSLEQLLWKLFDGSYIVTYAVLWTMLRSLKK